MSHSPTTFYSASAGSGKTYTLARDYLTLLFKSSSNQAYRQILAVTFTNKAVGEMKRRVLENLYDLAQPEVPEALQPIASHIQEETGLTQKLLQEKAQHIHQRLLHDYAAFDIVTIDSFNHRILRTFARDIELPDGFEVELDSTKIITQAINNLLARAGTEKNLTDVLIEFSLSKIDDNKSWDIEYDLEKVSKIILNENHYRYLLLLKEKELDDFKALRTYLKASVKRAESNLIQQGKDLLNYYNSHGLTSDDFHKKTKGIYNWISKFGMDELPDHKNQVYLEDARNGKIAGKTSSATSSVIDARQQDLINLIDLFQQQMGTIALHQNVLSSLTAMSLVNEILHEIDKIKAEQLIVPIYEFNGLLAQQVKDQPAPFIYERLGERYRHYFVDEFQDTSRMQWENLYPLIENPVVQQRPDGSVGSLMLVGDAKQSIYRWRGGDADQFLDIHNKELLFMLNKNNETLDTNWRSYDNIIDFNNAFFETYGNKLSSEVYKELYQKFLRQKSTSKTGGYVQIDFLERDQDLTDYDDSLTTVYPPHVQRSIQQALAAGFTPRDICVLVRKKKQGDEIARFLVHQGYSVVSADSLLVNASPAVQLLVKFMRICLHPDQDLPRYEFLMDYAFIRNIDAIHEFLHLHMQDDLRQLSKVLFDGKDDVFNAFAKAPLFQATELAAAALELLDNHDARLQGFLEYVYEFSQGYEVSLPAFLELWEHKQISLSVPAAQDPDAIQVMTIHKSKGLEFPVVIVPYCDEGLAESRDANTWIPVDSDIYQGFEFLYISMKKECDLYPAPAPQIYKKHIAQVEMDQINTLYVAFTRAVEQLYILALAPKKGAPTYADVLKDYVDTTQMETSVQDGSTQYRQGHSDRKSIGKTGAASTLQDEYYHTQTAQRGQFATRKGLLWASDALISIEAGNQLHHYLSQVEDVDHLKELESSIHLDKSLDTAMSNKLIDQIQEIVNDPDLNTFFEPGVVHLNERAILDNLGNKVIPDRLVFLDDQVIILDYKTGHESAKHQKQLNSYQSVLEQMGYQVKEKILIYTDNMQIIRWSS